MSQVTQVYGGDEINAIVLEPGSAWTRVGWSAEDTPSISVSTNYAHRDGNNLYGDEHTYLVRPNTEIRNPMKDSVVEDWEAAKGLWETALSQASPTRDAKYITESPLLITEPFWNTADSQKKQMQYALEELEAPAMYIAKSPVLALFSAGRGTGLVVDVGAQTCSVTPVIDGFCLHKPAQRSRKAGDYLADQCRAKLEAGSVNIVPNYEVKSKQRVEVGAEPQYTKKNLPSGITESFHSYQQSCVVNLFKEQMVQVSDSPFLDGTTNSSIKPRVFEFPDGRSLQYTDERFKLGESLFAESTRKVKDEKDDESMQVEQPTDKEGQDLTEWSSAGVSAMIVDCLKACDVDSRANLANNIVITGGTTLIQGFTERINQDLQREFPMMKIRLLASGNTVERKNGAWIGGSILASLGTFHQMWVTRQEFEEVGSDQIVKKRFR